MPSKTRPFCFLEWLLRSKDVTRPTARGRMTWPLPDPEIIDPPELGEEFTDLFDRAAECARNAHAWDEYSLDTILTSLHMPGLNKALALSLQDWCEYRFTFDEPGLHRHDIKAAADLFLVDPGSHPGREVDFARKA